MKVGVIILAGGLGLRMESKVPKQFMMLGNQPVVMYSIKIFEEIASIDQVIVVAEEQFRHCVSCKKPFQFASPGERRQDSLFNGLQILDSACELICIHDAARPFITKNMIEELISEGIATGAATTGMPLKFTVKEVFPNGMVSKTINRSQHFEIQTPQVIERALLEKGFEHVHKHQLTVTDDVGLVELLGYPVKVIKGCHTNIKLTTPDDWLFAESHLKKIQV